MTKQNLRLLDGIVFSLCLGFFVGYLIDSSETQFLITFCALVGAIFYVIGRSVAANRPPGLDAELVELLTKSTRCKYCGHEIDNVGDPDYPMWVRVNATAQEKLICFLGNTNRRQHEPLK